MKKLLETLSVSDLYLDCDGFILRKFITIETTTPEVPLRIFRCLFLELLQNRLIPRLQYGESDDNGFEPHTAQT